MYPPTVQDLQGRISQFPNLANKSSNSFSLAINLACGEIELKCPAAYLDAGLTPRLDRAAWSIAMDLAMYFLRFETERNADGDIPKSLDAMRKVLDNRIDQLGRISAMATGIISLQPFEPMDPKDPYWISQGVEPSDEIPANNIELPLGNLGFYGEK